MRRVLLVVVFLMLGCGKGAEHKAGQGPDQAKGRDNDSRNKAPKEAPILTGELVTVSFRVGNIELLIDVPEGTTAASDLHVELTGRTGTSNFAMRVERGDGSQRIAETVAWASGEEGAEFVIKGPKQVLVGVDVLGQMDYRFVAHETVEEMDFTFEPILFRDGKVQRFSVEDFQRMMHCATTIRRKSKRPADPQQALSEYGVRPLSENLPDEWKGSLDHSLDTSLSLATNSTLRLVAELTELKALRLRGYELSDDGAEHLSKLRQVVDLRCQETRLSDKAFTSFANFTKLQSLTISEGPGLVEQRITGTGLQHLSCIDHLRHFLANDSRVTDEGVKQLARFTNLESIRLGQHRYERERSMVSDAGVAHLTELASLKELDLHRTLISAAAIDSITQIGTLEVLNLGGNVLSRPALNKLASLTKLRVLNLSNTSVNDSTLEGLASLENLEQLNVAGTEVSNAGLRYLSSYKRLARIDVSNTAITEESSQEAEANLPKLTITR